MSHIKQKSDINESLIPGRKKFRTSLPKDKISINCIENLSNELFYEIFEYFDGGHISHSFSNLNYRFEHLITSSFFLLRIQFRSQTISELKDCCKNLIIPNGHRILSLYLENEFLFDSFFTYCIIDSVFNQLQSIILKNIRTSNCVIPLFYSQSLPRLHSLTMYLDAHSNCDLHHIYQMILSFSSLKYNKLSLLSYSELGNTNVFMPLAINEKFSMIEYLIIEHRCTLDELVSILHHTPRLHHLICKNLVSSSNDFEEMKLFNLKHIHIEGSFRSFEKLIKKLFAPIEVLRIRNYTNRDYLDANDWEELIKTRIPYLRKFDCEYHEKRLCDNDNISFFYEDQSVYCTLLD